MANRTDSSDYRKPRDRRGRKMSARNTRELARLEKDIEVARINAPDRPMPGKIYSLTGGPDTPSILRGDSWADSEVQS